MRSEMKIECPVCRENSGLFQVTENIPHFGQTLLSSFYCKHCGYRFSDVITTEIKQGAEFEAEVRSAADLNTRVVKSSTAFVEISRPEISVQPGPASIGVITNIEGLLEAMIGPTKSVAFEGGEKIKKLAEIKLKQLMEAKEGKIPFRVKLSDPFGNSALIGKNVKQRFLSKKEIRKLEEKLGF